MVDPTQRAIISNEVIATTFGYYTPEEIRKLSVKQIIRPELFDQNQQPVAGGPYDPAMGPDTSDWNKKCPTCQLPGTFCPGHMGHIELALPVYHPLLFNTLYTILRTKCFSCHHFRAEEITVRSLIKTLRLLDQGLLADAMAVEEEESLKLYLKRERLKAERRKLSQGEGVSTDLDIDSDEEGLLDAPDKTGAMAEQEQARIREEWERAGRLSAVPETKRRLIALLLGERQVQLNEYRRFAIRSFFKGLTSNRKCPNCNAFSPALRRDGNTKIFELPLSERQRRIMQFLGKAPDGVLDMQAKQLAAPPQPARRPDRREEDEDMGESGSDMEESGEDDSEVERSEDEGTGTKPATAAVDMGDKGHVQQQDDNAAAGQRAGARLLTPLEAEEHMRLLWEREGELVELVWRGLVVDKAGPPRRHSDHRYFFVHALPVTPPRFRPVNKLDKGGRERLAEHPQTVYFVRILQLNQQLLQQREPGSKQLEAWVLLQQHVNCLMDSSRAPKTAGLPPGIKQLLERKEGLFRRFMMGKRVNYAARSVISPDPNIDTNEIGVPVYFAQTLTFPQPVFAHNYEELAAAVINGPFRHPGANAVELEDGHKINLAHVRPAQRRGIARTLLAKARESGGPPGAVKRVYRHLKDGDYVLVNRQPTLHKPGIMAHRVRVLPREKTIRLHYANCSTYNADFDGDEMNLHFPQDLVSAAECRVIATTDNQYLVPRNGAPIRGLIQDNILTGVLLTQKDTFLERDVFYQLLYAPLASMLSSPYEPFSPPRPAILKPRPLWTGKQLITAVLGQLTKGKPPLTLTSKSKLAAGLWRGHPEEAEVVFRNGELLTGVVEKSQYGASAFGLVHACYELYGAELAGRLLTVLARLLTLFLQYHGFTCGIDDLLLTPAAEADRAALLRDADRKAAEAASAFVRSAKRAAAEDNEGLETEEWLRRGLRQVHRRDPDEFVRLDGAMMGALNETTTALIKRALPAGQVKQFPKNNLSLMTESGAKGSAVNASMISCLLGQQTLEGRRVPLLPSGKTLPCFLPFDPSPRAGGYITDRFLTGLRPQEYFFHAMAGREGLVDTAVKTSRSGYLQRCLIKHLEGLRVHYDGTVRDSDGSVVQFHYGEDGLDVAKMKFLTQPEQLGFFAANYEGFAAKAKVAVLEHKDHGLDTVSAVVRHEELKANAGLDPVLADYSPAVHLGAVSEKFQASLDRFVDRSPDGALARPGDLRSRAPTSGQFVRLMHAYYMRCLAEPGESVGLLAAQSIGEPSTQMTLNTFHLAGKAEVNVTLGIPRLRELLMTASMAIKTPTMLLPLRKGLGRHDAEKLAERLSCLNMSELVKKLEVTESLYKKPGVGMPRLRRYRIRIRFTKRVQWSMLERVLENRFVPVVIDAVNKELKKAAANRTATLQGIGGGQKIRGGKQAEEQEEEGAEQGRNDNQPEEPEDSEGEAEAEEDGARLSMLRGKKSELASYDGPDEEDRQIMAQIDKEQQHMDAMGLDLADDDDEEEKHEQEKEKEEDKGAKEDAVAGSESDSDDAEEPIDNGAEPAPQPAQGAARVKKHIGVLQHLEDYDFNAAKREFTLTVAVGADAQKLLLVSLLERLIAKFVVRCVQGIRNCVVVEADARDRKPWQFAVRTEGVNFDQLWNYSNVIDLNAVDCNDIHAILQFYGVEAARKAIIKEIAAVFDVYGISVDPRHLSLIADYMTFEGGYRPFNRIGIETNPSPFLKMSFETTGVFLTAAAAAGDYDLLKSPSACLVLGKVVETGTGTFELLQPLNIEKQTL